MRDGFVAVTEKGAVIQNPMLGIANRSMAAMQKVGSELGFSPTARARLNGPTMSVDELQTFLAGRPQIK